ncbi:hypothetical protein ACX3O0_13450 [Homoserinimonas sp. A447]
MAIASAHETHRTYKVKTAHQAPAVPNPLTETSLTWTHVPLVPQVALVGHLDGMPVAVIDQIGSAGFRAGLCNGKSVGVFRTLEECKKAVATAIRSATTAA